MQFDVEPSEQSSGGDLINLRYPIIFGMYAEDFGASDDNYPADFANSPAATPLQAGAYMSVRSL